METISRNIEDLAAFHAVATYEGFTRAAEAMGTSKAMVSKQVKRLETYMRTQLFHRTTRTLSLTEQGAALFDYSRKIFNLSDEASRRLKDMAQGTSGVIRISAPVSLGEVMMPELLIEAKRILPKVNFELDLSNENRDFGRDGIDFALRAWEVRHPDLIARPLGRIKDAICATPAFLKKTKSGLSPQSLANIDCILHSQEADWNAWTFRTGSKDIRVNVTGSMATNQYHVARQFCLQGLGVARIPLYLVAEDLKSGKLVELYSDHEISTHPLYLVYLRNEYATHKHKVVRDIILKWFKTHRGYFVPAGGA
jgi:DNA-binding transcriptional LysR family regulator